MITMIKKTLLFIAIFALLFSGGVFAATYDDYVEAGANPTHSKSAFDPGPQSRLMFFQARAFDFSSSALNGGSGVTDDDVIQLFDIPPNTYIMGFGFRITRAACMTGTSCTIGDGVDPDGIVEIDAGILTSTTLSNASVFQVSGALTENTQMDLGADFDQDAGISPYIGGDTIDMVIYSDKAGTGNVNASGVTPAFDAWVWGFHVPTN